VSALSLQTTGFSWFLLSCTSACKYALQVRLASLGVSCCGEHDLPRHFILICLLQVIILCYRSSFYPTICVAKWNISVPAGTVCWQQPPCGTSAQATSLQQHQHQRQWFERILIWGSLPSVDHDHWQLSLLNGKVCPGKLKCIFCRSTFKWVSCGSSKRNP